MSDVGPILRSARLLLRPLQPEDRAEYARVHTLSEELYRPYSPWPMEPVDQRFEEDLARSQAEWTDGSGARFVAHLTDGRHVAYVNLSQIFRRKSQSCVIGWRGNAETLRQSYVSEAVWTVLTYAFARDGLGLHRVQAAIVPGNVASLRVADKCGFRREGLALKYLLIAGEWRDHFIYAKLAEEHR